MCHLCQGTGWRDDLVVEDLGPGVVIEQWERIPCECRNGPPLWEGLEEPTEEGIMDEDDRGHCEKYDRRHICKTFRALQIAQVMVTTALPYVVAVTGSKVDAPTLEQIGDLASLGDSALA